MNQKIFKRIAVALAIIIIVLLAVMFTLKKTEEEELVEYIPQEEISDEQYMQTMVTLYFKESTTGNLMPEARLIDAKLLVENPYATLLDLLIQGPKNETLERIIPQGTKVNQVVFEKGIVTVDFSEEFIRDIRLGEEEEMKIVNSVVNTLFELTEVNGVKILVNGEENKGFADQAVLFENIFQK